MREDLGMAIADLKRDLVIEAVTQRSAQGEDPLAILEECRHGMTIVGDRFARGDYYLAELMLSAQVFNMAAGILEPYLSRARPSKPQGKVVLSTLKGDIHDLGKNILASLLRAQGFEVFDLGVDVTPDRIVDKVKEVRPELVGFSALMTGSYPTMKETSQMLKDSGLRGGLKLMVGGGVTTPMVKEYLDADFQTLDALAGVEYCLSVVGGGRK
ncbi:MAG: cobalamin-dependent protein [Dehalococcoidia bacterium]